MYSLIVPVIDCLTHVKSFVFSFPVDSGPFSNMSTLGGAPRSDSDSNSESNSDSDSDSVSDSLERKLRKWTLLHDLLEKVQGDVDSSDEDDDDGNDVGVRSQDNDNDVDLETFCTYSLTYLTNHKIDEGIVYLYDVTLFFCISLFVYLCLALSVLSLLSVFSFCLFFFLF